MNEENNLRYRYFFLSFSVGFLVLSILFLFLVITVHPATPGALAAELPPQDTVTYFPDAADAVTVLFVGTQTGSSSAGTFILVRFDPVSGSVPVVVFPPQTLVQNGDRQEPLSQVYQYGGADYARSALARTLEIPIDRYVRMNTDAFVASAAAVGTVEFDLPEDLPLEQGGMHVTLSAGRQLLDGRKVLQIITWQGYAGGETARCRLAGELTAAIVNQRMDVVESTLVDRIFERIINLVDSDITYVDYDDRREAARFLAQLQQDPAWNLPVGGRFDDTGTQYALSDTFRAQVTQHFL